MVAFLLILVPAATLARSLDVRVEPPASGVPIPGAGGGLASGASIRGAPGSVTVLVPAGERLTNVQLVYENGVAPIWEVQVWSTDHWHGWALGTILLRPRSGSAGGEARASGEPLLHLLLETAADPGEPARRLRPALDLEIRAALRRLVADPQDVDLCAPPPPPVLGPAAPGKRGFRPSSYPDLEGSPVRYLILTDAAFAADFQVLADWKTRRGVPAQVRTLDWVTAHARQGSDLAETLRNFIRDAYTLWGVEWVLLGGDTDIVPARFASSNYSSSKLVPTDMYYACLDGNWNANGNDRWGEAAQSPQDLGDQADLYPEVYVSRAPVRTSAEAQLFVRKTMRYETPAVVGYQDRALLLAEVLSPAVYDSGAAINLDGAALTEVLRTSYMPPALATRRLYETYFLYPGSGRLRKTAALDSLDSAGANLVNHMGHGYRYNMSVGDASIVNAEAEALTNGDRTFVLYLLNCTALAFDSNSLGERYMLAPGGGAVGVVGASRETYPNNSFEYNKNFYSEIFTHGNAHLAQAVSNSRLPRTPYTLFDTQDRWTHFVLNVLGDPQLAIYTGPARPATVTHPDTVTLDAGSVAIHVAVSGVPVDSASVCLWKGDESYSSGLTDAAGNASLGLTLDTPGTIQVTVSGRNLVTHLGSIVARAPAPPHLRVVSANVVDDGTGGTAGNGDGLMDAGERVHLVVQAANSGGTTGLGIWARLVSPDARVVATIDSVHLGDIARTDSLGTPTASGTFTVQLADSIADGSTISLQVQFKDGAGVSRGVETLPKVVHGPRLEAVELQATPAGPATDIRLVLENFGSGRQPRLAGVLTSTDPDVTVLQDTTSVGSIASFGTGTCVTALRVQETNTSQRNRLRATFTDTYGRRFRFDFDLRGPGTAAKPALDASPGPTQMKVTWAPSADADLLGYHVYRRPAGVGNLGRVTRDVVRVSYFLDAGLAASTRYDYAVAAVDSSGSVGALSPVATGSTNPPQLAGWPIAMVASTSSSVAIGDIDGDGGCEIVTGNDYLYAWHANGVEVRDGDQNALTWGVLAPLQVTITASVALGDLAPSRPGLEIVAASWSDNRVFAYDGAGNLLPGWPRQPSNGGTPGYWSAPTIADLDGDRSPEVLVVSKDGHLYGWRANGAPLVGADGSIAFVGTETYTSPTVANLDSDPQLEILVAGSSGYLYAFEMDGRTVVSPGKKTFWPKYLGGPSLSSPAVGEIDGNPSTPEIVVTSENEQVHVLDVKGNELPGWPKTLTIDDPGFGPSPALGDLNGDGRAEIVLVSNRTPASMSTLVVYDGATGNVLLQKLLLDASESSPILADVDGNGSVDIVVGGESGVVNAWTLAGDPIAGFPLTVGDSVRGTPACVDVDGDGQAELIVAAWNGNVYVWKLGVPYVAARAPWPTLCHDMRRTGNAATRQTTDPGIGPEFAPPRFQIWQNAPNPFNPTTSIRFDTPSDGPAAVDIFDIRGRLVRSLFRGTLAAGDHRLEWDGRDAAGRALSTGVYWYRVRAAGQAATRKMVLLK